MVYIRIVVVLGAAAGLFCRPVELSVDEVAKVAAIAIRDNGLASWRRQDSLVLSTI